MTRQTFLRTGAAAALGTLAAPWAARLHGGNTFVVAFIADTHILDGYYHGSEGDAEDADSLHHTSERLVAARDFLNGLRPRVERVFLVGDYFHDYPSTDIDFYFTHQTRLDRAKAITARFEMPVHVGFGNHDYGVPRVSREMSHELFRRKFGLAPYYSVDYRGWKFVHLNNFLGDTWNSRHAAFDTRTGSLGETQLNWLEAELAERQPTFVFVHYPLFIMRGAEVRDYGLLALLRRHHDTVQRVVSGHWHRWVDFGRSYGPPHLVMSATRYDPDAYLIVEIDPAAATHRLLNIDLVEWNTHYSRPYVPRPATR